MADGYNGLQRGTVLNDILVNENGLKEAGRDPTQSYVWMMSTDQRDASNPLRGLGEAAKARGLPPVDLWNPPFCGDIDMRIAADGTWFYVNSPIGRKPLMQLFASVLRHDEDGKFYLVTPVEKVGIRVDDAPFTAVRMSVEGEGRNQAIRFETNVDDAVTAGASHPLRFETEAGTDGLKPYVLVRARLEALVTRALFYDLAAVGSIEDGWFGVWSSGTFFPMQKADEIGLAT